MLKPRLAAATGRTNTHMWDFPDVIKFRVAAHTISDKAIRFRHPDYNPDRAQLISSSMSRHLSTCNISSKSMHAFLSNLANRQTDKRTRANAFTASFVGGNNNDKNVVNYVSCKQLQHFTYRLSRHYQRILFFALRLVFYYPPSGG